MGLPEGIETERLVLRRWRGADRAPFAALNADPVVMEFFPQRGGRSTLSVEQSDRFVDRIEAAFGRDGWGLWAAEVPGVAEFVGFVGLARPSFDAPFTPCVEVGWRLAKEHWGHGFAIEGARAAVRFGFEQIGLAEVLSFTAVANTRSRRVMEKIGMSRDVSGDFEHPNVEEDDPVRHHVLYRIDQPS